MGKVNLSGIETILDELRTSKNKGITIVDKAQKKIESLQKKIRGGETTGDYVTDLCILQFGFMYQEYEKELHENYSNLEKHEGELVLLENIVGRTERESSGDLIPPQTLETAVLEVGTIISPYLQQGKEFLTTFIEIPVKNKLVAKIMRHFYESLYWKISGENSIPFIPRETINWKNLLWDAMRCSPHIIGEYSFSLISSQLLIGNDNIEKYLKSKGVKEMPVFDEILKRDKENALDKQLNLMFEMVDLSEKAQKIKEEIDELEPKYKKITYHTEMDQDGSRYPIPSDPNLLARYGDLANNYKKMQNKINDILKDIKKDILPDKLDLSRVKGIKREMNVREFLDFISSEYKIKK